MKAEDGGDWPGREPEPTPDTVLWVALFAALLVALVWWRYGG